MPFGEFRPLGHTGHKSRKLECWGKTPDRNLPPKLAAIAADRALAVYLETLASGYAELAVAS